MKNISQPKIASLRVPYPEDAPALAERLRLLRASIGEANRRYQDASGLRRSLLDASIGRAT